MKKTIRLIIVVVFALCLVFGLAACGQEQEPVVSMSLNIASRTLYVGPGATDNQKTVTLKATVKEDDVTKSDAVVEWSSSDPTKATVEAGVVTAVAAGTATITATYGELTETCAITVEYVELITVTQTEAAIFVDMTGDATFQIEASVTGGGTITYASSDEAVATVDATGLVTGLTTGTANITVASAGAANVTCVITVTNLIEPYSLGNGSANYATVTSNPGTWYWFTQSAHRGSNAVMSGATFDPVSQTIKIDYDRIINGWDERTPAACKEYAFRLQPLLTENVAENVGTVYTFTATFISDKSGKLCIYDYNFGENVPAEEELEAKRTELGVETDLTVWYMDIEANEEIEIEFTGTISSSTSLTIRPYMFSDFEAIYPDADGETLGEAGNDPFFVMLKNMTFTVDGVEIDYRTGKAMEAQG